MAEEPSGLTRKLARFISGTEISSIPQAAYEHAKVAFMDWVAVTLGGKEDPLVQKLIACTEIEGGHAQATIVGHNMKKSVGQAALINGSASHALDYDDTLVSFLGHPSVTLFPSLLALAEWQERSGQEFMTAYLIGLQAGGTVGACAGLDHYMAGWHATSTLGHLASAAGCARLMGLTEEQTVHALGIGATQSSGLKRVFGTMCKPFHAGRSSQGGLMAALLAREGFTSAEDILEGPQGFFQVLKGKVNEEVVGLLGLGWDVENLSQKYHASCHATHSPLEAARMLVEGEKINPDEIRSIHVHSSQLALDAAAKTAPATGLEGKFSIPYCVANALLRGETGNQAFTNEKVNDPQVRALMEKVVVSLDPEIKALESRVELTTADGRVVSGFSDILQQIPPLERKEDRVYSKYLDLCGPVIGQERSIEMAERIRRLEDVGNMRLVAERL
jgi:2-methylcitrate dehydratase PrpD